MMLTKEIENIQYSIIHNRVSINKLKNDDIYIINELENKHNTFNLIK
jgi:4-hydroxy-3-methylbut-2-enyl diphosphate reductase IspH